MADPTLGLTYNDMRIRVAEFLAIAYYGVNGDEAAQLPVDAHDLELVSRLVNDGYRRFMAERDWLFNKLRFMITFIEQTSGSADSATATTLVDATLGTLAAGKGGTDDDFNGFTIRVVSGTTGKIQTAAITDYTASTGTVTVAAWPSFTPAAGDTFTIAGPTAVEGDNSRYFLPDDFYGLLSPFMSYPTEETLLRIQEVQEHTIRELKAQSDTTGNPSMFAIMPEPVTATTSGGRWEILFWPRPNILKTVTGRYRRWPQALSAASDRSVAGFQHDQTVLAAVMAEAELQRDDRQGSREQAYKRELEKSIALDAASAPRYGSDNLDGSDVRASPVQTFTGVDTVGGIDVGPAT